MSNDEISERGIYLMADTPLTAHPLALEGGDGDKGLLAEAIDENLEDDELGDLIQELIEASNRRSKEGTAIVCQDCGHVRQTTEQYPTLASCRSCGSANLEYDDERKISTDGGEDVHELEQSVDQALVGDVASAADVKDAFRSDGGVEMTLEDAAEPSIVGDCAGCGGRMIEFFAAVRDDVRRAQLRCQDCDAEAELRHDFEDGLEGASWSGLKDPEFKDVAWIDCPRCYGHGEIEDPLCDLRRAMNGREHPCPKCQATGSVPRIVETDGGTEALEIVHCGGCNGRSLLRDARAAGHRDDTTIDKPHCPRCGTRLSYEATEVVPYSPNDGRPGDDVSLEDALDGLMAAANYADDVGLEELSRRAADLYQDLGEQAPDEDWDGDIEEVDPDA